MVKKLFIVFLSLSILSFLISINDYLGLDLVFALDPDNYDILGFVSWNYNF